jgi:hypothetical protein
MATTVKIGGDTSGLDASLGKAQASVGKATAGIGRGLASVFRSGLGPFGELIEKADAFRASLDGASTRTKVFAGAVGLAMAATAFLVYKAVDAWGKMSEAIDEATDARKRFEQGSQNATQTISRGIVSGQEDRALKVSQERLAALEARIAEGQQGVLMGGTIGRIGDLPPDQLAPIMAEIATITKNISDIQQGAATVRGEARGFFSILSRDTAKAIDDERLKRQAAGLTAADINALKEQRTELVNVRQNQDQTRAGAITANVATESIDRIDRLLKLTDSGRQGTVRFAELASIGGASSLPGVQARQDATKEVVRGVQKTNGLLSDIYTEISNGSKLK